MSARSTWPPHLRLRVGSCTHPSLFINLISVIGCKPLRQTMSYQFHNGRGRPVSCPSWLVIDHICHHPASQSARESTALVALLSLARLGIRMSHAGRAPWGASRDGARTHDVKHQVGHIVTFSQRPLRAVLCVAWHRLILTSRVRSRSKCEDDKREPVLYESQSGPLTWCRQERPLSIAWPVQ